MTKAIFTARVSPSYDDLPEARYHFPKMYLNQVRQTVGDEIIYYEPSRSNADGSLRSGRQAYFAVAHVDAIIEDDTKADHFYAVISGFLNFDRPVPFFSGGSYYEANLSKQDGTANKGAFRRAVRLVSDLNFNEILRAGFAAELSQERIESHDDKVEDFWEQGVPFERPIVELTVSRPFRDRVFVKSVRSAYENRCALTGLHIVNGGGRPEVQAAHIMPVAAKGPDSIRNGLALSGTFHWLFDRGLISIDEQFRILVAQDRIPSQITGLLNSSGKIALPSDKKSWPHSHFLQFHRENIFKGA